MKIQFTHIGAIKRMDFELKPGLTVFCGPNNTGKTWAAYAIFSILTNLKNTTLNWISENDVRRLEADGMIEIDFTALTHSQPFLDQVSGILSNQLASDFDAPKTLFSEDCIRVSDLYHGIKEDDVGSSTWTMGSYVFKAALSGAGSAKKLSISLIRQDTDHTGPKISPFFLVETFNQLISEMIAGIHINRPWVLTAERSAISLFSKELSASRSGFTINPISHNSMKPGIGAKAARQPWQPEDTPDLKPVIRYPLPIRISLGIAENLADISKNSDPQSKYGGYARALEQEMLGGQIEVGEYGEIAYMPSSDTTSNKLRIHLSASMIKSLASLVIYLRYQAHRSDLLIIDEPELNLHPVNQRKIARFLCKLVNADIDVIISTHSDYIIREINNAIILKNPRLEQVRTRYGYVPRHLLADDLVTVVMFDASGEPKREAVTELGFAVESIDEEINLLNQISNDILWELEQGEGE